jgi:hypothetical protein
MKVAFTVEVVLAGRCVERERDPKNLAAWMQAIIWRAWGTQATGRRGVAGDLVTSVTVKPAGQLELPLI